MANITEFTNPDAKGGLQIPGGGAEAAMAEGRHISGALHAAGEGAEAAYGAIQQQNEIQDVSTLGADTAKATRALDDAQKNALNSADPNNIHKAGEDFLNGDAEDIIQTVGANVSTSRGRVLAAKAQSDLRLMATRTTAADVSNISGSVVRSNLVQSANTYSQLAHEHPEMMGTYKQLFEQDITNQIASHQLSPDDSAAVRDQVLDGGHKDIETATARGLIEKNPEMFGEAVGRGDFKNLSDGELDHLRSYSAEQQKALASQQRSDEAEALRQRKQEANTALSGVTTSTIQPDGSTKIPTGYYQSLAKIQEQYPDAIDPGQIRSAIDFGHTITKEAAEDTKPVTDPHTYEDFRHRLTLPDGDPKALTISDVYQARADGHLSDPDFNFFKGGVSSLSKDPLQRVADQQFNHFLTAMKSSITNSNALQGKMDPAGDQRYYNFSQQSRQLFDNVYKQHGNWQALLDPNNPAFLGKSLPKFQVDQKGAVSDLEGRINGSVGVVAPISLSKHVPRNPGESAAAYLARTGGTK